MTDRGIERTITDRVVCSRWYCGICHMQVCAVADATDVEILDFCNAEHPSGTTGGWQRVYRSDEDGAAAPVVCREHPERRHFMVAC